MEETYEQNADGIELDVQMTKDGELVVIHDETIDRVCEGSGWVKDFTYGKLCRFHFNKTHPEYEHAQIPTLEEVYALMIVIGFVLFAVHGMPEVQTEAKGVKIAQKGIEKATGTPEVR